MAEAPLPDMQAIVGSHDVVLLTLAHLKSSGIKQIQNLFEVLRIGLSHIL